MWELEGGRTELMIQKSMASCTDSQTPTSGYTHARLLCGLTSAVLQPSRVCVGRRRAPCSRRLSYIPPRSHWLSQTHDGWSLVSQACKYMCACTYVCCSCIYVGACEREKTYICTYSMCNSKNEVSQTLSTYTLTYMPEYIHKYSQMYM